MERRSLILLSLGILALFTFLYFKADEAIDTAKDQARADRPALAAVNGSDQSGTTGASSRPESAASASLPPVQNQITNAQAQRRDLLREITRLETTLNARRQSLRQRQAAVGEIQFEAESVVAEQIRNPTSMLAEYGEEVQQLTAGLAEMRATREALRREEEESLVLRENANKLAIAQIDAQLKQLEESQADTRGRLERWARDKTPVNGTTPRNEELEALFNQQQQQIDSLREERLSLTTNFHVQADAIYNLSQQARAQLREEEQSVRSQIFSLQNEIRRIQRAQTQARMSQQTRTSRLQQARQTLESERQEVRALEASLEDKRRELRGLASPL